jgi:hypothetical protein
MQITVVAVMCHTIGVFTPESVGTVPAPVCREVIVVKDDRPMQSCMLSQAALADWKERSIYRGGQWGLAVSNACRGITCRKNVSEAGGPRLSPVGQRPIALGC